MHRVFFGDDPAPEVIARYIEACRCCGAGSESVVDRVVARGLDAEAVELALRVRKGPVELTRRIRILFYLLEVRSEYYGFFVGEEESLPRAAWGLALAALQTAAKYLKGAYLVRRHRLV